MISEIQKAKMELAALDYNLTKFLKEIQDRHTEVVELNKLLMEELTLLYELYEENDNSLQECDIV